MQTRKISNQTISNQVSTLEPIEEEFYQNKSAIPNNTNNPFINIILLKRFIIVSEFQSSGSFGKLFIANDTQNENKEVFVKISSDLKMSSKEFSILSQL
jgi:hypothetical protein